MLTLADLVERKYQQRHRDMMEAIINGVRNWDDYNYVRGYLRGMHDILADIAPYIRDPDKVLDEEE